MPVQSVEVTSVATAALLIAGNLCHSLVAKGLLTEAEFMAMLNKIVRDVSEDNPDQTQTIRRTLEILFPHAKLE